MMCPHCGRKKSRVTNTDDRDEYILRYRMCLKCAKPWTTIERLSVYVGRAAGHVEVELPPGKLEALQAPVPMPAPQQPATAELQPVKKRRGRPSLVRFIPADDYPLFGIREELRPLLLQWWRESRWSKHRSKATWTEAAWQASLKRVSEQSPAYQRQLVEAGVEFGWQALDPKYLDPVKGMGQARPTATGRPMPRDPSMLAALESWGRPLAS